MEPPRRRVRKHAKLLRGALQYVLRALPSQPTARLLTSQHAVREPTDYTAQCFLEQFQKQDTVQAADRVLRLLGKNEAEKQFKVLVIPTGPRS